MKLRVAEYNMEWMNRLFNDGQVINTPVDTSVPQSRWNDNQKKTYRSQQLISILKHIDFDILAVVEGPDTLKNGTKTIREQLEDWMQEFGLTHRNYRAIHGHPSPGRQELGVIYDADKLIVEHTPESDNSFADKFLVDTLEQNIHEQYSHFRPPLEVTVKQKSDQRKLFKMIVAHAKSKGIFDQVDYARYEHLSNLNRRKLYAECMHIRNRVDKWLERGNKVIVTGDINDGMGSDFYEGRFGKSAIETLMGSVYKPEWILKSAFGRPKLNKYGWSPSSSKFTDAITKNWFTVLIDHILVSQDINVEDGVVINPYSEPHKTDLNDKMKSDLKEASDHFPIYADLVF